MKTASQVKKVKELLRRSGREAAAVINCGMESEMVCHSADEIPDDASYFTLMISKQS